MSETLQEYRGILQTLFPTTHPDQLKNLSRDNLLDLIAKTSPGSLVHPPSPITPGLDEVPPSLNQDAANLEQLQPMPEEHTDTESWSSGLKGITDDVNALSLSVKRSASYLGISSVTAVLRVILWLDPQAQAFFTRTPERSQIVSREASSPPEDRTLETVTPKPDENLAPAWEEVPLINAYFVYVHPLAPLIDEDDFRNTYMTKSRNDSRWLLVLNTILALGSLVNASNCDEHAHKVYWHRAKQHLTIETLGMAHIEIVQALGLLSGLYLHYIQQPNLANSLMGAALRLATVLGLHRDYSEDVDLSRHGKAENSIETRRRVWWSLFVLDAWASYGLGRPSMGRMSHAITAKPPQETLKSSPQIIALIQENIRFCIISTKMEDALAHSPIIAVEDRRTLDASYVEWFQNSSVQNNTPQAQPGEPHGVSVIKNIMRWRYLLCRVLVHRPVLLWWAMRKVPFARLPDEKKYAVSTCREATDELVGDIATTWRVSKPSSMAGWHGTWLLYQALMVPLLLLFADRSDPHWTRKNQDLVEIGLTTFVEFRSWSQTASRSFEAVSRIYQASKRHNTTLQDQTVQPQITNDASSTECYSRQDVYHETPAFLPTGYDLNLTPSRELLMDNMFDSLNWSTNWGDETFPFTQSTMQWDQVQEGTFVENTPLDPLFGPVFFDPEQGVSSGALGDRGDQDQMNG